MKKELNYLELSAELDDILAKLQAGDLEIDQAVSLYERGMVIVKDLENYLKTAENKVQKIKKSFE